MPGLMFHLLCADYFDSGADDMFYIGNFAPDCIQGWHEKDISHFRDKTEPGERDAALRSYAAGLDLSDSFSLGTVLHLYLDCLWDFGPMAEHKKQTPAENWFTDYRREVRLSSSYAYYHTPSAKTRWKRLLEIPTESYRKIDIFKPDDIYKLMNDNYIWHEENNIGPSLFFTPEKTNEFVKNTARSFNEWRKDLLK